MLQEALTQLAEQAVGAAGVKNRTLVFPVPGSSTKSMIATVNKDNSVDYEKVDHEPPKRSVKLLSIDQVAPFVAFYDERYKTRPTVWIDRNAIRVVCDDQPGSYREDKAHCDLLLTGEWNILLNLAGLDFTQKALVRFLRLDMANAQTEQSQELLRVCRSMNCKVFHVSNGSVGHKGESIGRSIDAEVQSDNGEIPERIEFRVRVFDDKALQQVYPIRVEVTINAQEGTVNLSPNPRDMQMAEDAEREKIESLVSTGLEVPLFHGTP